MLQDTCIGDSGAPLWLLANSDGDSKQAIQIGLTSRGNGCALIDQPGVFTKIKMMTDWIFDKINGTVNKALHASAPITASTPNTIEEQDLTFETFAPVQFEFPSTTTKTTTSVQPHTQTKVLTLIVLKVQSTIAAF